MNRVTMIIGIVFVGLLVGCSHDKGISADGISIKDKAADRPAFERLYTTLPQQQQLFRSVA